MTLTDPVPLPAPTAPSANSAPIGVQPLGLATVIVYVFHVTNRNIRSPAAGEPGMVTDEGSATIRAQVPAVLREIATVGYLPAYASVKTPEALAATVSVFPVVAVTSAGALSRRA